MIIFEVGGAVVVQGAVQPGAVVSGDVLHDRPAGSGPGVPGPKVGELALQRGEERLGHGVVPALALAAHRWQDLAASGEISERSGGVLQPRSEWKITPAAGSLAATALASASATSSVRR